MKANSSIDRLNEIIRKWLMPPGFWDLLRGTASALARRYRGRDNKPVPFGSENTRYCNIHNGERCFICATGPSIKNQNIVALKNELCISVSHFFLHELIDEIRPKYHVLVPYHPPLGFRDLDLVFNGFRRAGMRQTEFFFGITDYEYSIHRYLKNKPVFIPDNYRYIDYRYSVPMSENNYADPALWDIAQFPFAPRTVLYCAIQLAAYMGFNKIYLLGCDHDYLADFKRVTDHHFYKEEDGTSDKEVLSAFSTERWFEEYYTRWRDYRLMKSYLASRGVEIYNATPGSYLDVFEMADFDSLFQ